MRSAMRQRNTGYVLFCVRTWDPSPPAMSTIYSKPPQPPFPTAGPTMSSASQSSPNSNTGLGSPGMNYFFGFLLAFITLLLLFVGCGIGARRSLMRSRRLQQRLELEEAEAAAADGAIFGDLEGLVVMRKNENVKEPVFWDRWIESGGEKECNGAQWESMTPLAAIIVPEGVDAAPPPSLYTPRLPATPNWLRPRTPEPSSWRRSIRSMIVMPFMLMFVDTRPMRAPSIETPPSPPAGGNGDAASGAAISLHSLSRTGSRLPSPLPSSTRTTADENALPLTDDGDVSKSASDPPVKSSPTPLVNVQIMVMVAMPSNRDKVEEEDGRIPQIQFGITRVPVLYDDDESVL